jgi:hypothetical protein
MENSNPLEMREWVARQTAYLEPPEGWQPDATAAFTRFRTRRRSDREPVAWRLWLACTAAAAVALVCILLVPAVRVAAQQLWQSLKVKQVTLIRVNAWPEGVPSPKVNLMGTLIPPIPALDATDASRRVNYTPRLPRSGVLNGSPQLSTTFSLAAGTVVKVADLQLALQKAGITGVSVPTQWEGAQLALHTSGIVIAQWPDAVLVQSLPLTLTAPPGFDFPAWSALILRIVGVAPDEAARLAEQAGTSPPWLAPIDRGFKADAIIEQVMLNSGPATLVEDDSRNGSATRVTLAWSVPDRVYAIHGTVSRELAIAMANAVQ